MPMDDTRAALALHALSQVHRLAAFRALVVAGQNGLTPGALCERLGISPASMSFHLKELSHAGLVSPTRAGRHVIYRASHPHMNRLLDYLTANCCGGEACGVDAAAHRC